MKVLIVDDDFISLTKMETIFETFCECVAVDNGKEALNLFSNSLKTDSPFNIVALDITMPEMDGTEVLGKLRQMEQENVIPKDKKAKIIMVTSHSDTKSIMSCLQAGCTDYIVKPFNLKTIIKKLEDIGIHVNLTEEINTASEPPLPTDKTASPQPDLSFKTLVIDDDMTSMMKMEAIMEEYGQCDTADNGKDAFSLFKKAIQEKEPYSLITLDIGMPGMDGTELLFELRSHEEEVNIPPEQHAIIMMVTSHTDKDNYITCQQAGCNEYIIKPFDNKSIASKLKTLSSNRKGASESNVTKKSSAFLPTTNSITEDIVAAMQNDDIILPTQPDTSIKFRKLIQQGASLEEIENLLKTDIGIAPKIIAISNTAFYKGITPNATLVEAITRMGLKETQRLVEAISNRSLFDTTSKTYKDYIDKLWKHSIQSAYASQFITEALDIELAVDPFTLGLFHDIGKVILLQIINELNSRKTFGAKLSKELVIETIDRFHFQFGATLLERWSFSQTYQDVSLYHNSIEKVGSPSQELVVVCFANLLVKHIELKGTTHGFSEILSHQSADILGITGNMATDLADKTIKSSVTNF